MANQTYFGEGIGESTPQLLQPLAGFLSDKTQKRKSLIAGFLWQSVAPAAAFSFGATMACIAALGLLFFL